MRFGVPLSERLAWKLFLSYLVILLVAVVVLAFTAELEAPTIVARDIAHLENLLKENPGLAADLHDSFTAAVNELLAVGISAAILAALIVSLFTARRIMGPIQAMMRVSRRIAAGDYRERVELPSQDELGALAKTFNQMAETLEQTEQRRLELIADVAHELRTPLSSIRSSMEALVDGVLPAEPSTFLDIQREVIRLQRLVHDLEELSRAESGQISLTLHSVTPAELIQAAADRLRPQFEDKGVGLSLDVPTTLPKVRVDAGRITQVLLNLLGNALQYTLPGGHVTVRARGERREMVITVQDTGVGIAAEHLPHIFERFYRVDKSRARSGGGSGIGLTIAKHLVLAHGGCIEVASPGPGAGSTFTFSLPLAS